MAAVTPTTVRNSGASGDSTLIICEFPNSVDDGDTWASGLGTRVKDFWTMDLDNPSTQAAVGVAATNSSGTFTFYPAEDNKPFYLYIHVSGS